MNATIYGLGTKSEWLKWSYLIILASITNYFINFQSPFIGFEMLETLYIPFLF